MKRDWEKRRFEIELEKKKRTEEKRETDPIGVGTTSTGKFSLKRVRNCLWTKRG